MMKTIMSRRFLEADEGHNLAFLTALGAVVACHVVIALNLGKVDAHQPLRTAAPPLSSLAP